MHEGTFADVRYFQTRNCPIYVIIGAYTPKRVYNPIKMAQLSPN